MLRKRKIFTLGLSCLVSLLLCTPLQAGTEGVRTVVINKSVRKLNSEIFSVKLDAVKDRETVEFMLVVQNLTDDLLHNVRVIDTFPKQMGIASYDTKPDESYSDDYTNSYMWMFQSLGPGEQQVILYRVKVDFTAESDGKCFRNVANIALGNHVKDTSQSTVCVVGGDNVLGAITMQPDTGIFDYSRLTYAFALILSGVAVMLVSSVLKKKVVTY